MRDRRCAKIGKSHEDDYDRQAMEYVLILRNTVSKQNNFYLVSRYLNSTSKTPHKMRLVVASSYEEGGGVVNPATLVNNLEGVRPLLKINRGSPSVRGILKIRSNNTKSLNILPRPGKQRQLHSTIRIGPPDRKSISRLHVRDVGGSKRDRGATGWRGDGAD